MTKPLMIHMKRWYLVQTKPRGELLAQSNLQRQRYEVYFPRLVQPVLLRGRWRKQVVALFPRYMFLRLDEGRMPVAPVRSTLGVASVVRFGSEFAVVPDKVIADLRARASPESGLHELSSPSSFARGTAVKITAYPFDGLEGVFECEVDAERAVVLLNLLGRDARVRVPTSMLVPSRTA
jgi:transcriptional antiterminator RfaH